MVSINNLSLNQNWDNRSNHELITFIRQSNNLARSPKAGDKFEKPITKKQTGFFAKMNEWSQPFYNNDGRLSTKEKMINVLRGACSIITKACSTPKRLLITSGVTVLGIGAGVTAVSAGLISAPLLLTLVGVASAGLTLYNAGRAAHEFIEAKGNEEKLAEAYLTAGETITDAGMTVFAFHGASHATKLGNQVSKLETGGILSDNSAFVGGTVSESLSEGSTCCGSISESLTKTSTYVSETISDSLSKSSSYITSTIDDFMAIKKDNVYLKILLD